MVAATGGGMTQTLGYAAKHSFSELRPMTIERAAPAANEVSIAILFCGVCHSDVHQAKNEWKNTLYPCMPGHEIIGRVTAVGASVTRHAVGDTVGVGCMVDSCHACPSCTEGLEQYCSSKEGFLGTYNSYQRAPSAAQHTYGGYSEAIVVREDFVLKIPAGLDLAAAAPLLCAGVTTYSPMKHWNIGAQSHVGIVGLGGLGHIAVKLARALGARVTVVTTSPDKRQAALALGATHVIVSTDAADMTANEATIDFLLSTIPQPHDPNPYLALLKRDGLYAINGCIAPLEAPLDLSKMIIDRKGVVSSLIGGIAETQEVLDFCAQHGIVCTVKVIPIDEVNDAFKAIDEGEPDFRYVIDMASLRTGEPSR